MEIQDPLLQNDDGGDDDDDDSFSPSELKKLKIHFDSDEETRRKIEETSPELAQFFSDSPSELDIELAVMSEEVRSLEAKLVIAEAGEDRPLCCSITKEILIMLDKAEYPAFYGMTSLKLGTTLAMLSGEHVDRLNECIAALTDAVGCLPAEEFYMVAIACYNLNISYADERLFDWENADDNWRHCIEYGEKALALIEGNELGKQLKTEAVLLNLGMAYRNIGSGVTEDNYDKAIGYFERLLKVLDKQKSREAIIKKLLALEGLSKIYTSRKRGDPEANGAIAEEYVKKANEYV